MKTKIEYQKEIADAIAASDFDKAKALTAEMNTNYPVSGFVLPADAANVIAGDTGGGWQPEGPIGPTVPIIKSCVRANKKSAVKDPVTGELPLDYRLEMDLGGGVILKSYLSTLKGLWKQAQPDLALLEPATDGVVLRADFMIQYDKNTGSDAANFPFRAKASKR